ncbi:hypothetical protein [Nocardioides sp.]|uniref:hypothetical protein n=1 Tax=Nocardioides sp. TaxID=35761 RepID=UPI002635EAA1|nr:hypothetical protein [Nocardioides sp.]
MRRPVNPARVRTFSSVAAGCAALALTLAGAVAPALAADPTATATTTVDPSATATSTVDPSATATSTVDPSATTSSSATASTSASSTEEKNYSAVQASDYPTYIPATSQTSTAHGDGLSITKDVTRTYYPDNQATPKTVTNRVTVTVNKHTDLQARERIHVTWSGAHPTGGRATNPLGSNGLNQEYPVVVMECRGTDSASVPAAQQVSPSTCWTTTVLERTTSIYKDFALWNADRYATESGQVTGIDQSRLPSSCTTVQGSTYWHITPYITADKKLYSGCDSNHMPPESSGASVDPPNEMFAFTAKDGTGLADFEARTSAENASLGCSSTVPCTLVVIPIQGLSCANNTDVLCNRDGNYAPGTVNDPTQGAQRAVSPQYWWSPSNWRNRISVPLTFAAPPSVCSLIGQGDAVPFYGSELMTQAALQWTPAYCLNKKRFNWQMNAMPDDAGFVQMTAGSGAAAMVSGRREGDDNVAYAPSAVTGWGVAFDIDKPNNQGQQMSLKLNARLIAKLLTQSYAASAWGRKHPGMADNPLSINLDPEFQKLNPGLDTTHDSEAAAALLTLSTGSDAITQMTSYIAADAKAMAFINGKADPWGMKVNPAYKKVKLPVSTWPLLDTWELGKTGDTCLDANPSPYFPKVAAPVSSLRLISLAMLFNWPNVNTYCVMNLDTGTWQLGRIAVQGIGQRFMMGTISLGDAARYGLTMASLEAKPGHYVAPTQASMAAAVKLSTPTKAYKPFTLSQAKVKKSTTAYPGTMVVYTAAKATGLDKATAQHVGEFIKISLSEGQVAGRGNGKLPDGYLPIRKSGATAALYAAGQKARTAILAQKAITTGTTPGTTTTTPAGVTSPTVVKPGSTVPDAGTTVPGATTPTAAGVSSATTVAVSSSIGGSLLPLLLIGGLLAGLVSFGAQVALRMRGLK